jgi:mannitol/fructose-specific phosphotransferase system IIA component (Ntr-type)
MRPELIRLEMVTAFEDEDTEEGIVLSNRKMLERKKVILSECVDLLALSGRVANKHKLLVDLLNREKKATTAIGRGIVIPHVRSMQAKELIIGIACSRDGYDFDAIDGKLSHIFIPMAAPPYDDNLYLKVFKSLAEMFHTNGFYDRIMTAQAPYDVIRIIQELE